MGGGAFVGRTSFSSFVGVEAPLPLSVSEHVEESEDSESESGGVGGDLCGAMTSATLHPLSTEPRGGRSIGISGSTVGSGGRVGAGVASPEAVARLSDDKDRGTSMSRSGSGGAENRSENPPPVLTGGADLLSSFSGSGGGDSTGSGSGEAGFCTGGGGGRAGGGFGLGGGPEGLAGGCFDESFD